MYVMNKSERNVINIEWIFYFPPAIFAVVYILTESFIKWKNIGWENVGGRKGGNEFNEFLSNITFDVEKRIRLRNALEIK